MTPPVTTHDMLASETTFLAAMRQLGYGRIELLRIERGELVDPWPITVRDVKFGAEDAAEKVPGADFTLKKQVAELFHYVRSVESGEIRVLEIKNGLPFSMKIHHRPFHHGGRADA